MVGAAIKAAGVVAVLVCIATSILMNWHFGKSQGGSEFEAQVLGGASIAFDVLKVVVAWQMWQFIGAGRWGKATIAGVFAMALTVWALNSAIGFMAQTRGVVVGGREAVRASLLDAEREVEETTRRRATINTVRAPAQVESEIAAELVKPVMDGARLRGSVDQISSRCTRADTRTVEPCARINVLRQELANAAEATGLDRRLGDLRSKIETLRMKGGNVESNPQASMVSGLTRGWLSITEVVLAQSLFFPVLLELCAAFGLAIVLDGEKVRDGLRGGRVARDQDASVPATAPTAAVVETPAPAIVAPAQGEPEKFFQAMFRRADGASVPSSLLYRTYKSWCESNGLTIVDAETFVRRFKNESVRRGVTWATRDGKPHLIGVKLAA